MLNRLGKMSKDRRGDCLTHTVEPTDKPRVALQSIHVGNELLLD